MCPAGRCVISVAPVRCSCDSSLMMITITIRPCRPGLLSATTFIMHVSWDPGWQECVQQPQVRAGECCAGMTCVVCNIHAALFGCATRQRSADIYEDKSDSQPPTLPKEALRWAQKAGTKRPGGARRIREWIWAKRGA